MLRIKYLPGAVLTAVLLFAANCSAATATSNFQLDFTVGLIDGGGHIAFTPISGDIANLDILPGSPGDADGNGLFTGTEVISIGHTSNATAPSGSGLSASDGVGGTFRLDFNYSDTVVVTHEWDWNSAILLTLGAGDTGAGFNALLPSSNDLPDLSMGPGLDAKGNLVTSGSFEARGGTSIEFTVGTISQVTTTVPEPNGVGLSMLFAGCLLHRLRKRK